MDVVSSQRSSGSALPKIAVIVPNRNDSRYLPRCIRSILEQEDPPDELVVVDDQSTDDRDRKSTRLNSSHGYISYAVFCLKKKKINKAIYTIYATLVDVC